MCKQVLSYLLVLLRLCLLQLGLVLPAESFEESYLPLGSAHLTRRVIQKEVAGTIEAGSSLSFARKKISLSPSCLLEVRGCDKAARPWSCYASFEAGSASIWAADLDRNGENDLIVYLPEGSGIKSNDLSKRSRLLILMFEKNGRPFPWLVDGFFQVDRYGVKDLLDLDLDGKAELIRQDVDDGYWLCSIYEAGSARWSLLRNMAGLNLPLYTRYSSQSNRAAIIPAVFRNPKEKDLSNQAPAANCMLLGRLLSYAERPDIKGQDQVELTFSQLHKPKHIKNEEQVCVILEEKKGRRIVLGKSLALKDSLNYAAMKGLTCRRMQAFYYIFDEGKALERREPPGSLELAAVQADDLP